MEYQTIFPKLLNNVHSQISFCFVIFIVSFMAVRQIVMMCCRLGLEQLWVLYTTGSADTPWAF